MNSSKNINNGRFFNKMMPFKDRTNQINNVSQTALMDQNKLSLVEKSKEKSHHQKYNENSIYNQDQNVTTEDSSKMIKDLKNWRTNFTSTNDGAASKHCPSGTIKQMVYHSNTNMCSAIPVEK